MNNLSKSAKFISLLLNLLCWAALLGSLLYGLASIVSSYQIWQNPSAQEGITSVHGITLDYISFYSEEGIVIENSQLLKMSLLSLPVYFVQVPLTCYGIQLLRKLLALVSQKRPFSGASRILKKLGWVSLSVALIQNVTDWAIQHQANFGYQLSKLFLGSSITNVSFQYKLDSTFLVVAVVVFILSGVFRYGEELQQLSDETL